MAHLKLNFAVMAILLVMLLEVEASRIRDDCVKLSLGIIRALPGNKTAHHEDVFEVAKTQLDKYNFIIDAWKFVKDCATPCSNNVRSFRVIDECRPKDSNALMTLARATEDCARRCLTDIISDQIKREPKSMDSNRLTYLEKFIDRQFIDDTTRMAGFAYPAAAEYRKSMIAKAVNRHLKEDAKNLDNMQLFAYLADNLYGPCLELVENLNIHLDEFKLLGNLAGVASLDEQTQGYIFRNIFCKAMLDGDEVWSVKNTQEILSAMATSS